MSLECDNKDCGWGQLEFWSFRISKYGYWKILPGVSLAYNPFSYFMSRVFPRSMKYSLLIPKRVDHDVSVIEDYGWSRKDPHNWWLIKWLFLKMIKEFIYQKWWTYNDFKKDLDNGKAFCPKCGGNKFNID